MTENSFKGSEAHRGAASLPHTLTYSRHHFSSAPILRKLSVAISSRPITSTSSCGKTDRAKTYGRLSMRAPLSLSLLGAAIIAGIFCAAVQSSNGAGVSGRAEDLPARYADFPPTSGQQWILTAARFADGDTFDFYYLVPARARLYGCDAPEITGATKSDGERSKEALFRRLGAHQLWKANLFGKDSFGRVLLDPIDENGDSISTWLVEQKYASKWKASR